MMNSGVSFLNVSYPKETRFEDLPPEMQQALLALEQKIQDTSQQAASLPILDLKPIQMDTLRREVEGTGVLGVRLGAWQTRLRDDLNCQGGYAKALTRAINQSRRNEGVNLSYAPINAPSNLFLLQGLLKTIHHRLQEIERITQVQKGNTKDSDQSVTLRQALQALEQGSLGLRLRWETETGRSVDEQRRRYEAIRLRVNQGSREPIRTDVLYK